jgi:hypothetical protein
MFCPVEWNGNQTPLSFNYRASRILNAHLSLSLLMVNPR